MLTLVLVRHGETAHNVEGRYQGRIDPPLTARGACQAVHLRTVLRRVLPSPPRRPTSLSVNASDTTRARATATLALPDESVLEDVRLRELDFGVYDARTYAENLAAHAEAFQAWIANPRAVRPPGGETLTEMEGRVADWLSSLPSRGSVIAFTHAGVIHTALSRLLSIPFAAARRWTVAPGDGVRLLLPAPGTPPVLPLVRLQELAEPQGSGMRGPQLGR